jgi:hypothetical protein
LRKTDSPNPPNESALEQGVSASDMLPAPVAVDKNETGIHRTEEEDLKDLVHEIASENNNDYEKSSYIF